MHLCYCPEYTQLCSRFFFWDQTYLAYAQSTGFSTGVERHQCQSVAHRFQVQEDLGTTRCGRQSLFIFSSRNSEPHMLV